MTIDDSLSVGEWVARIKSEPDSAMREIYLGYRRPFANWIVGQFDGLDDAAVKDIFQDSIMALYENIIAGRFRGDSKLKTYLFGIGRNAARVFLRRHRRNSEQLVAADAFEAEVFDEQLAAFFESESNEIVSERIKQLAEQLKTLTDPCRSIVMHYYYHRRNTAEIAQLMGYLNADVVKAQKYRCMTRLLNYFKQQ